MSRGRQPVRAQDAAIPIAENRGLVMRYQHRRGNTCDMTIMIAGLVVFVTVKRLDRLTCLPEDIAHDFSGAISLLRFIVSSPGISRELWLCTPHGAWRFFRILDDRIIELDRDGRQVENSGTGSVVLPAPEERTMKNANTVVESGKKSGKSGRSKVGKNPVPDALTTEDFSQKKDPKPVIITEKYAKPVKVPEQKENTGPVKDRVNSVPDSLLQKNPEPEKELILVTIPEKFVVLEHDPGPVEDPSVPAETEKIPAIIKKFLKRRSKGLEEDPGSE
jgi:hypothetical protein